MSKSFLNCNNMQRDFVVFDVVFTFLECVAITKEIRMLSTRSSCGEQGYCVNIVEILRHVQLVHRRHPRVDQSTILIRPCKYTHNTVQYTSRMVIDHS